MMKLFYSAGSCSTSCHISLEESGLQYEAVGIDWEKTEDPNIAIVTRMNPLGTLPVFITEDGKQLDQNVAIHNYIGQKAKNKKIYPEVGTPEHYQLMNWLSFVASDLHKSIGAFFGLSSFADKPETQAAVREFFTKNAHVHLKYLDSKLEGRDYLLGAEFSGADAYAFVVLGWTQWVELSLQPYPNLQKYLARIASRPAVHKVLQLEGLLEE